MPSLSAALAHLNTGSTALASSSIKLLKSTGIKSGVAQIPEDCSACDACVPACPHDAIAVGDPLYLIDALRCTADAKTRHRPGATLRGRAAPAGDHS